jgi:hypothetical protein
MVRPRSPALPPTLPPHPTRLLSRSVSRSLSRSPGPQTPDLGRLLGALLAALLVLIGGGIAAPALAAERPSLPLSGRYLCDGDLLVARLENGAVDAQGLPNTVAGTVPGAFVVIDWRGLHLQLPRTNNAGAPSFTDGRWWWGLEDPERPDLRLRRAEQVRFACEPLASGSSA